MDISSAISLRQVAQSLPASSGGPSDVARTAAEGGTVEKSDGGALNWLAVESGSPTDAASAASAILAGHDLSDISPREFSEMLQQLHSVGALSDAEFQELALIRLDLDLDGLDPFESIDLVEVYSDKLEGLKRELADPGRSIAGSSSTASSPGVMQHNLDWLKKAAAIQADPQSLGLDTLA